MIKQFWILIIFIAILETFSMSIIEYSANKKNNYYIIGIILYAIIGYILYKLLINGKLAITNAIWNSITVILVTFIGVFVFKETLNRYECIGIFFAILSVLFMEMNNILKIIK